MKTSLPAFNEASVLVVGDVMLDRYWFGSADRISPEAPVPVVKVRQSNDRPGGAANVAFNLAALGAQVSLSGLVGNDESADILKKEVDALGVQSNLLTQDSHPTITKLRVQSANQQLIRLDFEEKFNQADADALIAKNIEALGQHKVIVLSDYAKGTLYQLESFIQAAKQKSIPVIVDPKGSDFSKYKGATLLTPNMKEFEFVVGAVSDEQDLVKKATALITEYDFSALLITRSEKGMTLVQANHDVIHIPTLAQEVFDVTGAGDTVVATLAASLAAGVSLSQSCMIANAAAGCVVGKMGTSTVSPVEISSMLLKHQGEIERGVVTPEQLVTIVHQEKLSGKKIVMTNGCFDILHAGHVSYLQKARALGDRLIVAVNSDSSVKALKGESRPVNPCSRRMAVLSALSSVDWVVEFSEDTPQQLIAKVLPNTLVKGGDYQIAQIAGHKEVLEAGGDVKVLNFEDGCSTSLIIESILEQSC